MNKTTHADKSDASEPIQSIQNKSDIKETLNTVPDSINTTQEIVTEEKETPDKEKRVSLFGFGEYPTIPDKYRDLTGVEDIWGHFEKLAETNPDAAKTQELVERVLVKLWNQGFQPDGAQYVNNRVFPHYPMTIYVKWDTIEIDNGTMERVPSSIVGDPSFAQYELEFYESDGKIFPSGYNMLDYDKDSIDPYEYLKLNR